MTPTEATSILRNALPKDRTDRGPVTVPADALGMTLIVHDALKSEPLRWGGLAIGAGAVLAGFALGRRAGS